MVDHKVLDDFMLRFYGYGAWEAPVWFIGMEEGGGNTIEELELRLAAWDGSDKLADVRTFHSRLKGTDWFSPNPRIQRTWGKLIRIALALEGKDVDTESVRRYQRDELARHGGSTALIELLPLPSPSTAHWLYESLKVSPLRSRESYREAMLPQRTGGIRRRLKEHRPDVAIFYGLAYRAEWEKIIEQEFQPQSGARFLTAIDGPTHFVLAPHPAAKGVANSDYDAIAEWIGRP